jgi:hypothetical protein
MKDLTLAKAANLARLAEKRHAEYRERHPGGGIVSSTDLRDLVFEPESEEAAAYRVAVENLTKAEAQDAVALMYVGRGDHLDEEQSLESVRDAFEGHHHFASADSREQLIDTLLSKTAVMHRYLKNGIDRVRDAF